MIQQPLTWTTGTLTCTQMLMHATAHGGVWTHIRQSALKVDSGRKITWHTKESNLRQQHAGTTLHQQSYIPTPWESPHVPHCLCSWKSPYAPHCLCIWESPYAPLCLRIWESPHVPCCLCSWKNPYAPLCSWLQKLKKFLKENNRTVHWTK